MDSETYYKLNNALADPKRYDGLFENKMYATTEQAEVLMLHPACEKPKDIWKPNFNATPIAIGVQSEDGFWWYPFDEV